MFMFLLETLSINVKISWLNLPANYSWFSLYQTWLYQNVFYVKLFLEVSIFCSVFNTTPTSNSLISKISCQIIILSLLWFELVISKLINERWHFVHRNEGSVRLTYLLLITYIIQACHLMKLIKCIRTLYLTLFIMLIYISIKNEPIRQNKL